MIIQGYFARLLQVHDAILVEAKYKDAEFVAQELMPWAMREMVPIYPSKLNGVPAGTGPYYLGIEADVMERWGESLTKDQASEWGLPTGSYSGDGVVVNYAK